MRWIPNFVAALALIGLSGLATGIGVPESQAEIGDAYGLSPYWDWKTIETENFRITFPAELAATAEKAANFFEEAHRILSRELHWQPRYKAQILLVDNMDAANGITSPLARFGILLYLTPPDNWFSTTYYDDWLRLLVFHEYTHFLNMDATRGVWAVTRFLFGDILLPNAIWPPWMLEGLAVYNETRFTRLGRGRSTYYEMMLRAAVDEGVLDSPRYITLDKVNGPDPYWPFGESVYHFGYELMNQLTLAPTGPDAADGRPFPPAEPPDGGGNPGELVLGEMSRRSSRRIPFLINSNLKNIRGWDWYGAWSEWVAGTRARMGAELARIRAHPVTAVELLTHEGGQTLGFALSPDGRWLAYTTDTSDQVMSFYVRNLVTGELHRIGEKLEGATVAFTPDSRTAIYSSLQRFHEYDQYSELGAYDLVTGEDRTLSHGLRARDPDVSRDGGWVTFTLTRGTTTGLAVAPLKKGDSGPELGEARILYMPPALDAVHTPKFSASGREVFFTLHRNGLPQEDLMALRLGEDGTPEPAGPRTLVADGHMNRFPAVKPGARADEVWYVSDATGVDNIYRYRPGRPPEILTNVTTGLWFPAFDSQGRLYADSYSTRGFDIARVSELSGPRPPLAALTVPPPPAPPPGADSDPHPADKVYPVDGYSIWPSILPREWLPYATVNPAGLYFGIQLQGFDAVDRHEYLLDLAYNTQTELADYNILYANRSLGPTIAVSTDEETTTFATDAVNDVLSYQRRLRYNVTASYPIQFTYSVLTPSLAFHEERDSLFSPGSNAAGSALVSETPLTPYADALLLFTNTYSSRLAISPEDGRFTLLGERAFLSPGVRPVLKTMVSDSEYLRWFDWLWPHSVLVPTISYSWSTRPSPYSLTPVAVLGRASGPIVSSLPLTGLDQLALRGYPNQAYYAQSAGVGSLEYRFPIAQIFRGWGTNPAFLENVSGFVFGESAFFPSREPGTSFLPSAGGGLRANTEVFVDVPLIWSLELDHGFNEALGGANDLYFQFGIPNISI